MASLRKLWGDNDLTISTKRSLITTLIFPVVTYGCESWTLRKADIQRIDAFKLWCRRRMLRIPWTARRTNKSIVEEIKPPLPLQSSVIKQKLAYFGHIMGSQSMEKDLMLGQCGGKRKKGRPCGRWIDDIMAITGKNMQELAAITGNRTKWRRIVMGVTRSRTRLDGTR